MVVVMGRDAAPQDVAAVVDAVRAAGGDAFVSRGRSHTIIGLVGDAERFDALNLHSLDGVAEVVRISAPYKLRVPRCCGAGRSSRAPPRTPSRGWGRQA
jgi:3-deoxy-7-phosphoheptulonate synthase